MKVIRGLKIGGLQQKIFNLMLIFILALIAAYTAVAIYQQNNLTDIAQDTSKAQQEAITAVSEETMRQVLDASMTKSTGLQAYIVNDLFSDVRSDVLTLQSFATELYARSELFPQHPFSPPLKEKDGEPSAYVLHEPGVNPQASQMLGLTANMSEIMMARYTSSDNLSGCFSGNDPLPRPLCSRWFCLGC